MPLCTLWIVSAFVAYDLAVWFANDAYDKQLINSADSVAARLKADGRKILVDLPPAAQAILRYNNTDKFYFQILEKDGSRLSGDAVIPGPVKNPDSEGPVLRNGRFKGKDIRIARIRVDVPNYPEQTVLVQVAETLNTRNELAQHILLSILIPQLVLIALGAFAVWRGVSIGLAPLKILEDSLARRSQMDLTPVEQSNVREIQPLVHAVNGLLLMLAEDIESQKRFVANAAHQFRTPLAALKTYIYYAKRLPADKKMNEVLDKIDSGTERMSHLSNKLLALAKAEPSPVSEKHEILNLNFLASEVTVSFVPQATDRNLELVFRGAEDPASILGNAHNLRELIANLVENAVFYTPPGGHISVCVSKGDRISLTVLDTGPGIPVEERGRVFERFYRVLGVEASGSGLGLSIVKEIALAHNAEVSINDAAASTGTGPGTAITVTFADESITR